MIVIEVVSIFLSETDRALLLQSNCYMSNLHVTNIERFTSKCKTLTQGIWMFWCT